MSGSLVKCWDSKLRQYDKSATTPLIGWSGPSHETTATNPQRSLSSTTTWSGHMYDNSTTIPPIRPAPSAASASSCKA